MKKGAAQNQRLLSALKGRDGGLEVFLLPVQLLLLTEKSLSRLFSGSHQAASSPAGAEKRDDEAALMETVEMTLEELTPWERVVVLVVMMRDAVMLTLKTEEILSLELKEGWW
ncbi:hypothetical protein CRENBAI_012923 [Crenichthys baileyi]|uniref:Uncharacterized protein n=1 Tax=Crenichthys baileyi TaxID=28760 RepID=A0AAV9RFH2_9TELE